MKELISI